MTETDTLDGALSRRVDLGGDFFEQIISAIYRARVKPGEKVVDVGANWGRHTLPLAERVGRNGRVVAIEALPHLAANLAEMTQRHPQVRVINKAVSHDRGQTEFAWVKKDEGFSGIRQRTMPAELAGDVEIIKVKKSTIDREAGRRWPFGRRVSFVKLDIEGGEYDALRGAKRLLANEKPMIVFENGGQAAARSYGYTEQDFFELFDSISYEVFDIFGRPLSREIWRDIGAPWYLVGAVRDSADAAFVRHDLPQMIESVEREYLSLRVSPS